jgi:hypothetical protein
MAGAESKKAAIYRQQAAIAVKLDDFGGTL